MYLSATQVAKEFSSREGGISVGDKDLKLMHELNRAEARDCNFNVYYTPR